MGGRPAGLEVLQQAVESGLKMQLTWGAPVAVVEAGGLQVHVVEDTQGFHFGVEFQDRFAKALRQGLRATQAAAVMDAAEALVDCLAERTPGALEAPLRRLRRAPVPMWHTLD